jgi:hypothetical protein
LRRFLNKGEKLITIRLKKGLFSASVSLVMAGTILGSVISANAAVTSTQPQQIKQINQTEVSMDKSNFDSGKKPKIELSDSSKSSLTVVKRPVISLTPSETSAETLTDNSGFEHRPEKITHSSYKTIDSGLTDATNVNSNGLSVRYTQSF